MAQHLITALAGGFREKETLEEVRTAWSYRKLSKQEWDWTIEFIVKGGKTLGAYDQFRRVICGMEYIQSTLNRISRFHRMSIGTITSDPSIFSEVSNRKNSWND